MLFNKLLRCIVRHGKPVRAGVMAMSLLYKLHIMVKCVYYMGLWIHWIRDHDATIPNGTITIGWMSLVGVGHSGSDPMWATGIILQVPRDSINPTENG